MKGRGYDNEPVEEFLKKWGFLTQGLTESDIHVPVPVNAHKADRALREYFAYRERNFVLER